MLLNLRRSGKVSAENPLLWPCEADHATRGPTDAQGRFATGQVSAD